MTRSLAILPARGGSKRIPNKAIVPMEGRPMISSPWEAARQSGLFAKIHVSTDSTAIAETVTELGFPVDFMRAPEFADDITPLRPVLSWVVRKFLTRGERYDDVALIYPTAVMLEPDDLRRAYEIFLKHGAKDSVLAVTRYAMPIERSLELDNSGYLLPYMPDKL